MKTAHQCVESGGVIPTSHKCTVYKYGKLSHACSSIKMMIYV